MSALGFPFFSPTPSRERVAELFQVQRARDPIGLGIHEFLALGCVFFAGWPTTYIEWAGLPVAVCALIRLSGHIHVPGPLLWDPAVQLVVVWVALLLGSWFWTVGAQADWVAGVQSLRFIALLPALYMVSERRRMLIIALALGIVCGQFSQIAQVCARVSDLPWLIHQRLPGRDSGWWDPVVGGSILCAGLGLHMGPLVRPGARAERAWGAAGFIATLACIFLTGTRGAMIGAACVMLVGLVLTVTGSVRSRSGAVPPGSAIVVIVGVLGVVTASLVLPPVRARIAEGQREIMQAAASNDYTSYTGQRIAAWKWSAIEFAARPIAGVGAGGFQPWAAAHASEHPDLPARTLPHAHSMYFHALATTGILGAVGLVGGLVLAVRSGLRDPDTRTPVRGYDAGPAFAIVGLLGAGFFDTIQVNQQTANLMFILITLCISCRPPPIGLGRIRGAQV